jgi:uncharacterized membrane protein YfcA
MKAKSRVAQSSTTNVVITSCVIIGVVGVLSIPLDIAGALLIGAAIGMYAGRRTKTAQYCGRRRR